MSGSPLDLLDFKKVNIAGGKHVRSQLFVVQAKSAGTSVPVSVPKPNLRVVRLHVHNQTVNQVTHRKRVSSNRRPT